MKNQLEGLLCAAVNDTGLELKKAKDEVAVYMAERTAHLAQIVGLDGFDLAVIAERDNVAMFAGLSAVAQSDAIKDRVLGILQGALWMGAHALSGGAV